MRPALATLATALVIIATGPALAQSADWTGFYGAVQLGTNSGSEDYNLDGTTDYTLKGSTSGALIGHNWGSGQFIYGAEIAASQGGVYEIDASDGTSYEGEYEFDRFFDVKGRLGYAINNALVFGTLGYSSGNYLSNSVLDIGVSGLIFGVGVDYQVGGKFFVGAEYLKRSYEFTDEGTPIKADIDSLALRVGMKF